MTYGAKIKVSAGLVSSEGVRGKRIPWLFDLLAASILWLVAALLILCFCGHIACSSEVRPPSNFCQEEHL